MNEEKDLRQDNPARNNEIEPKLDEKGEVKSIKSVNPMIILAVIILIAAIATYIVPAGAFEREPIPGYENADRYNTIVQGSFEYVENEPVGPFELFTSLSLGLQDASYIIAFLLILGGVFQIVEDTGALHAGISNLIRKTAGKELILIPLCFVAFSTLTAFAACCEEYLAFLPLMYLVCMACGFDSLMAVSLLFVSSAIGYAGGMTNAFTVGVAQTISGLPLFSGMGYRIAVFIVLMIVTIIYLMWHGHRIKKNPQSSPMYDIDKMHRAEMDLGQLDRIEEITGRQKGVLTVFIGGFVVVAFCVIKFGFYIDEMSGIFLIVGLLCAVIGGLRPNTVADSFVKGAGNLLWAGLIIGMCYTATNIMQNAQIMDTLVYGMGNLISGLPAQVSACGMFFLQDLLNFLVPSGSGQAAITMPFMAPLSDLLGVTRQTAVLAFQLGDAFTNAFAPTSGEIMAALAICHVPYKKWFRFILPLWLVWSVIACIALVIAVGIGYM